VPYGKFIFPDGLPVATKFPGEVAVPARDRPACKVLMHCEALTDQPRVVAHVIVLKLQAHISATFSTIPIAERASLLATLYALQYSLSSPTLARQGSHCLPGPAERHHA
jgi:hypothetical protein